MAGRGAARRAVAVTGMDVVSAPGRGLAALGRAAGTGAAAFGPVRRFAVAGRTVGVAAEVDGGREPAAELAGVIEAARTMAGLGSSVPVLLALHADARTAATVAQVQRAFAVDRVYTCACVAASTAVADAAARISLGHCDRAVVAAGYLVEPDTFAVFDAGRALARDGVARPFSTGRSGLLLGDAVAAVVLEAEEVAGAPVLARIAGWGRSGDAYHVCRPVPDGSGLGRAVESALERAGLRPGDIGYINANATGSPHADSAEAAALARLFGRGVPVSSSKSVHGHALEASALLELVVTILALRSGGLPVNAGLIAADADLDLVAEPGRAPESGYALTLNSAFGGANTALVVAAP